MHPSSLWLATTAMVSALVFLLLLPASAPEPSRATLARMEAGRVRPNTASVRSGLSRREDTSSAMAAPPTETLTVHGGQPSSSLVEAPTAPPRRFRRLGRGEPSEAAPDK